MNRAFADALTTILRPDDLLWIHDYHLMLLPFYPSPLKDDGYDIADYYNVHPMYGTLGDFRLFLREAHRRGLRVITELVLNHTSDQHSWFQRSRRASPGSRWRNFYVWRLLRVAPVEAVSLCEVDKLMLADAEDGTETGAMLQLRLSHVTLRRIGFEKRSRIRWSPAFAAGSS